MRCFDVVATAAGLFFTALVIAPVPALAHGDNSSGEVIHACVHQGSNQVRLVGVNGACANNESPVHWAIAGPQGSTGPQGPAGPAGSPGTDAPAPEYGVAAVSVQRGAGAPSIWARYSTRLGSPVGDTTGGAFRFTCSTANAPCKVSLSAAALSNVSGNAGVYPRVLIQRQSFTSPGPQTYCEYGDGSFDPSTPDGVTSLTTQTPTASPAYTPVPVHIGGSADCGGPNPTAGLISEITVPSGYYDVISTFTFVKP